MEVKERIREKIEFAKERTLILENAFSRGFRSELEKLGAFKLFQEIVESLFDAIALYLKSKGLEVKDRYSNVQTLFELQEISEEEKQHLVEANGLRNWIIHRYNKISEEKAIDSMKKLLPFLRKISERFERWTK